jgi:acyl carrier protein
MTSAQSHEHGTGSLEQITDRVARLWAQLLNCDHVERDDDFFDLGGNSILAVRMTVTINEQLDIRTGLNDIVEYPTVGEYAAHVAALVESS